MTSRMLLLKLCATLAAMICGGCMPNLIPSPSPKAEPQQVELKIKVEDGQIRINDAKIDVRARSASSADPLTDDLRVCVCGCAKIGCTCSTTKASAAPTVSNAGSEPQYVTQYVRQQVCENGVCRIVSVPVRVLVAANARAASGGKIVIYDTGSAAGRAMRDAIGTKNVDWKHDSPPVAINGVRWSPTAVKPDGSAWTPGATGWHAGSLAQYLQWIGH